MNTSDLRDIAGLGWKIVGIYVVTKLVMKVSGTEAWFAERFERGFLRSTKLATQAVRGQHSWFPLPFSLIAVFAFLLTFFGVGHFFASSEGVISGSAARVIDYYFYVANLGSIFIAFLIHCIPSGNRKVKYEFLVAGVSISSMQALNILADYIIPGQRMDFGSAPIVFIGFWTVYILLLVTPRIVFSLWFKSPGIEGEIPRPSFHIRRLYYWMKRTGLICSYSILAGELHPLLTVYLILRYVVGERMSSAPILYLRSFHYVEGPTAFGKIVSRVASRYGVLVALVHKRQSAVALHAKTRLTARAELAQVPDETWQNWLEQQMVKASVVIIDYSVDTQGVSWELDRAMSLVDSSKILLLNHKGVVVHTPPKVWKLEYEMGPEGEKQARKKLNELLRTVLLSP